jgi:SAM-dependent methyltransferase
LRATHKRKIYSYKNLEFPPEFDANIYKKLYKNIAYYDDASLLSHYENQGKKEGKRAFCLENRLDFVDLIPRDKSVLELGPFFRPLMSGKNVSYFDILDKEALVLRAKALGFPSEASNCPDIHFVSSTGDLSIVNEKFDFVLSSHVIEHQPNLVGHLKQVENILKPNGHYFLMAPDRRYTFDYFIPESNIAQVITAYLDNKKLHSLCSILEQTGLTTHNDSQQHWKGEHGEENLSIISQKIRDKLAAQATDGYVDVHAWYFTPDSFRKIMTILNLLAYTQFKIERIYNTLYGTNEFWVILKKSVES